MVQMVVKYLRKESRVLFLSGTLISCISVSVIPLIVSHTFPLCLFILLLILQISRNFTLKIYAYLINTTGKEKSEYIFFVGFRKGG